ncbi:MAG TPA: hypothetical protein VMI54_15200 [Polyangiaceae bacterium]|nr:hypothetical protein [Polyangiaceae bacterium]
MIAGHFGFAAAVKAKAPRAPLWALMLASVWMDVIFVPLFAAGIEPIEKVAGTRGGYGEGIIHADYTHSLVGALVIAVTFGLVCAIWWRRSVAVVLAAVVFSHWLLDLPMHRADMPLLPGNAGTLPLLGFGLWRSAVASALLELALVLGGTFLYARAAAKVARTPEDAKRARTLTFALAGAGLVTLALNLAGQ